MNKTKTMKEMYTEIIKEYGLSAEHKAFIESRIEQIDKKSASRVAKPNEENERLKAEILEYMVVGTQYRAMEIEKGCNLTSPQKATSLLGQLEKAGKVNKVAIKGVAYFTKVSE